MSELSEGRREATLKALVMARDLAEVSAYLGGNTGSEKDLGILVARIDRLWSVVQGLGAVKEPALKELLN